MLTLFKLEYCSQLWCPTTKGNIQAGEMVQRNFLRKIAGIKNFSYWEQLRYLKLYSLERRRERYRIIYILRILESISPNIQMIYNYQQHPIGRGVLPDHEIIYDVKDVVEGRDLEMEKAVELIKQGN